MKRLVLLFDGTWNDDTRASKVTNVFRLRELVEAANRSQVVGDERAVPQRIYYDEGVGTHGLIWHLLAGATGMGLNRNIKEAYRFLANYYTVLDNDRDEIYIAGFSRGAFTARSLAGFVAASGLLKKKHCNKQNLAFAWKYYRTPPKKRYPSEKAKLEELCAPDLRIKFLGVFDTVGALGIPVRGMNWIAAWYNRFHDTKLGSSIDYAYHAIAIDEYRWSFVPALWARPDHNNNREVQQVWFPGVHSDVGGGFPTQGQDEVPPWHISLSWMISRLRRAGLDIEDPKSWKAKRPALPSRHEALGSPTYRLILETDLARRDVQGRTYKLPFPDHPYKEFLHLSALELLGRHGKNVYRAPNLKAVLSHLSKSADHDWLKVVDYEGNVLPAEQVQTLIAKIRRRRREAEAGSSSDERIESSTRSQSDMTKANGRAASAGMQN
jgi:hypothetical protein